MTRRNYSDQDTNAFASAVSATCFYYNSINIEVRRRKNITLFLHFYKKTHFLTSSQTIYPPSIAVHKGGFTPVASADGFGIFLITPRDIKLLPGVNTIDMGIAIIHHNPEMFCVVEMHPPMFDKSHPIFGLELQKYLFSKFLLRRKHILLIFILLY